MAVVYAINGVSASLAPYSQQWQKTVIGTNHLGAPIYARKRQVTMSFDEGTLAYAKQWTDLANGASHTLDVLDENLLTFVTLSPVYVTVEQWPETRSAHASEFSIRVTNA